MIRKQFMTLEERIQRLKYYDAKCNYDKSVISDCVIISQELHQKNDLLQLEKGELIKALRYIAACDNATQSAAKAIELLKKYDR